MEPEIFDKLSKSIKNNLQAQWDDPKFWSEEFKITGKVYAINNDKSQLESILKQQSLKLPFQQNEIQLYIYPEPFAKGTYNYAYYAKDIYDTKLVVKRPINKQGYDYFIQEMNKNGLCTLLSNEFNKELERMKLNQFKLYMIHTFIAQSDDNKYYIFEGYIPGEYIKITNNTNSFNQKVDTRVFTAFTHYTWHISNQKFMVTDLQGVGCFLTDPVIHSIDQRFKNNGDWGQYGQLAFFSRHQCNILCEQLNLQKLKLNIVQNLDIKHIEPQGPLGSIEYKTKEKCKNKYCNLSAYKEHWCKSCIYKLQKQDVILAICNDCSLEFQYNPFFYHAMVKEMPKRHEPSCQRKKNQQQLI